MALNLTVNYLRHLTVLNLNVSLLPLPIIHPLFSWKNAKISPTFYNGKSNFTFQAGAWKSQPLSVLFKRSHHETLNTQKTTGTEIMLTLTWQIILHTDVEFNALCSLKDAFQYLSWWDNVPGWKFLGISGFLTLCCHHRWLHQWEIHCIMDSQGELCPQMPRRDLHSDAAGRRAGGVVVAT